MNLDELKVALESKGFRIYPNYLGRGPWIACRRRSGVRRCECNETKDGIQVVATPSELDVHGTIFPSVELDVTGEFEGRWYKLQCYSLKQDELVQSLDEIESALVRAWEALKEQSHGR